MVLELIVAAVATGSSLQAPPPLPSWFTAPPRERRPAPPEERLPNGGRACLIVARCDTEPCSLLVAPRRAAPRPRCGGPPPVRAAPHAVPITD